MQHQSPQTRKRRKNSFAKHPQFTPDSQQLINNIEEISDRTQHAGIAPFRFSNTSKRHLRQLCRLIHKSTSIPFQYTMQTMTLDKITSMMNDFSHSDINHIPRNLFREIRSAEKIGREITFCIEKRNIVVCILLPKPSTSNSEYSRLFTSNDAADTFFHNCIQRIIIWLRVIIPFSGKSCSQSLNCYLFLSHSPKLLPSKSNKLYNEGKATLGQTHANTAFTWPCEPQSNIVLYRIEEWFKVFIHETFHTLGLDFSLMDTRELDDHVRSLLNRCISVSEFCLYETYCEVWAEIIHSIFVAYFTENAPYIFPTNSATKKLRAISNNNHTPVIFGGIGRISRETPSAFRIENHPRKPLPVSRILAKAVKILHNERIFSIIQMNKVLSHSHLTYDTICSDSHVRHNYTEQTPVISYYVLKSVLLFYMNDFVNWCATHNLTSKHTLALSNTTSHSLFYFNKTNNTLREYGNLIESLYKLPEFAETVNIYGIELANIVGAIEDKPANSLLANTMRMTMYELRHSPTRMNSLR
jgi:hypothetical protein